MEAIILAGGFGTRLKSTIGDTPKPMALVKYGSSEKPFLEVLMRYLAYQGFKRVILAVHYMRTQIIDHFGAHFLGMEVIYSKESEPLGTGGAIKRASKYIKDTKFFVLNGDTFVECKYKKIYGMTAISIVLKEMLDCSRYGRVLLKDNIVDSFLEKETNKKGLINAGVYLLTKNYLAGLPEKFSFEKDFLVNEKCIKTYITKGYFIDIGVPEDYFTARAGILTDIF